MKELLTKLQNALPMIIGILLIVALVGFALWWFIFKTKHLKIDAVYFISGGVKTGKSVLSLFLAIYKYYSNLISWFIRKGILLELNVLTFWKVEKLKDSFDTKKPMFYTNMPCRFVRWNRFTIDILERNVRIPNKSVILLDEVSLLADSKKFGEKEIDQKLMIFYKLWGHYSHGGTMIINSQAIADCHHALRRCMSKYLYIYSRAKFPFVSVFKVAEQVYSDDQTSINVNNGDMEKQGLMTLVMPNFIYKFYDCYYLSIFTDSLAYQVDYNAKILKRNDSLKVNELVTLQDFSTLDRRDLKNEKK